MARTAIYAAPEALAPSPGEASLEAAYDVEFSNDNTTFSRVPPSDGDAGFWRRRVRRRRRHSVCVHLLVATERVVRLARGHHAPGRRAHRGARLELHAGRRARVLVLAQDATADDGVSLVAAASRSRVRSSPRRSSRRSTRRRRQYRHLGWISVVTGTLRTCGEAPFQLCNCAIFLSTCVWVKLARRATRNPPIQYLTLVFLRAPRTLQVFTAAQLQVAMFARDLGRSSLAGNFLVSLGVRLVARTMPVSHTRHASLSGFIRRLVCAWSCSRARFVSWGRSRPRRRSFAVGVFSAGRRSRVSLSSCRVMWHSARHWWCVSDTCVRRCVVPWWPLGHKGT